MSDLEAKAREIAEAPSWQTRGPGHSYFVEHGFLADIILHALREERERAAKIARAYDGFGARADVNLAIAAAIRGEDNG